MLNFVELFAGAGSWHLALQPLFNHHDHNVLVYETNKVATEVFKDNVASNDKGCTLYFTDSIDKLMGIKYVDFCVASINAKDIYITKTNKYHQERYQSLKISNDLSNNTMLATKSHEPNLITLNKRAVNDNELWMLPQRGLKHDKNRAMPLLSNDKNSTSDGYLPYGFKEKSLDNFNSMSINERLSYCNFDSQSSLGILLSFCRHAHPKVVIIESSCIIRNYDQGIRLIKIEREFKKLGYESFCKILNSKDFGVPHNKNKLYIIAIQKDLIYPFNDFEFPLRSGRNQCLKDILESEKVEQRYFLSSHYWDYLHKDKVLQMNKGSNRGMDIVDTNGLANAIVKGSIGLERNLIIDPKGYKPCAVDKRVHGFNPYLVRKLTPREYARLQGYPDDFKFNCSRTCAYELIAKSICIPTVRAIVKEIIKCLCSFYGKYLETQMPINKAGTKGFSNQEQVESKNYLRAIGRARGMFHNIDHNYLAFLHSCYASSNNNACYPYNVYQRMNGKSLGISEICLSA